MAVAVFHQKWNMSTSCWHYRNSQGITKVKWIHPLGTMNFCTKCHDIQYLLRQWSTSSLVFRRQFCQICHFLLLYVVKIFLVSVLMWTTFTTISWRMGRSLLKLHLVNSGWWDGCYFDRNILPVLALTTLVVKFIWICCHVISFCSNYSWLVGKGKSLFKPLCQCLADKGCSDITPV